MELLLVLTPVLVYTDGHTIFEVIPVSSSTLSEPQYVPTAGTTECFMNTTFARQTQ